MGRWWRWALVTPDGVAPSRMVGVSASVNFPLHHKVQKFSSGTGSPGWSQIKGRKTAVAWWFSHICAAVDSASRSRSPCSTLSSSSHHCVIDTETDTRRRHLTFDPHEHRAVGTVPAAVDVARDVTHVHVTVVVRDVSDHQRRVVNGNVPRCHGNAGLQ